MCFPCSLQSHLGLIRFIFLIKITNKTIPLIFTFSNFLLFFFVSFFLYYVFVLYTKKSICNQKKHDIDIQIQDTNLAARGTQKKRCFCLLIDEHLRRCSIFSDCDSCVCTRRLMMMIKWKTR